ncbi:MAG: hypothetical protein LBE38_00265 [Deltaproteobacteria bacterium]|jgi:hypothetical protein|nr:hypothetical protein [Deltaproteobacteria bacterium]
MSNSYRTTQPVQIMAPVNFANSQARAGNAQNAQWQQNVPHAATYQNPMILFYSSLVMSLFITIIFFFEWVSIAGASFFGISGSIISICSFLVEGLKHLNRMTDKETISFIVVSLVVILQFLIPLNNVIYCLKGLVKGVTPSKYGIIISSTTLILIVLFTIILFLLVNDMSRSSSGMLGSNVMSLSYAPIIIFVTTVINLVIMVLIRKMLRRSKPRY